MELPDTTQEDIRLERVRLVQGSAGNIAADEVDIHQGGAASIEATNVTIEQGGAGMLNAETVSIVQGGAGVVYADTVSISEGSVGMVVAGRVEAIGTRTLLLLSREVHGSVETVLDTKGAFTAGAVAAIVVGFLLWMGRLLRRRG